ncbi:MAG: hypothetical protein ACYC7A_11970 [Thermoanaerobaculia bacterium]
MKAPLTECSPERFRLALFRAGAALRTRFAPPAPPAIPTQLSPNGRQSPWETYPVSIAIHLTIAVYVFSAIHLAFRPGFAVAMLIALACVIFAPVVPSFTAVSLALLLGLIRHLVPPFRRIDPRHIENPVHWALLLWASFTMTRIPLMTRWVGWFWLAAAAINAVVSVALRLTKGAQPSGGTPSAV